MPTKEEFIAELRARFRRGSESGANTLEINSGELHRASGGYPGRTHQMPSCCKAMLEEACSADQIVSTPPSGYGASLTIRYKLPR